MCIGLFCLLILATLSINHFFMRSAGTGVLARAALISALYERESRRIVNVMSRSPGSDEYQSNRGHQLDQQVQDSTPQRKARQPY